MSNHPYPENYYWATANRQLSHPQLSGDVRCDVCVVGGGVTGISTALELAEQGYEVVLLEAKEVGSGASGRNGGQYIFGYSCSMKTLRDALGAADARRLWDWSLESIRHTQQRVEKHHIDCDWRWGHLHVGLKDRHTRELREWQAELARDYGYETQLVEGEALREFVASERYLSGLFDAHSGHLHPLNYTLGLAQAATDAGVRIFEHSPAQAWQAAQKVKLQTPQGQVEAAFLVLAGNAYLGKVGKHAASRLMPVGTYIAATEPLGDDRAKALLPRDSAVADVQFVLDYYRLSADGRLLFGGGASYSTLPPLNMKEAMRKEMLKVFPQLSDVQMEFAWGGFVGITLNRAPHFGRLAPNVVFAQGFSGHGVSLTGFAGKILAEAVAGTAERFDVFARIPHLPFPGGRLLRTPSLVLAMTWFKLRDLL